LQPAAKRATEKTKSCIHSTTLAIVSPFIQNSKLLRMLCDSSFDIASIGSKQTIVYVIYPDEKKSLNFLVNAFLTQCYETLITTAADAPFERLPVRVNFVLDEFSNLPEIANFDNRISEARSRNIRYHIFIQSFEQLTQKYSKCAETILSNCSNWLCFSSKELNFLSKISAVCGKEVDYNGVEHDLISPFDMQHLVKTREYAEVLVIRQGSYPYVAKLPDFDQVKMFRDFKESKLQELSVKSDAKFISFVDWYNKIASGSFRIPFPAEPSVRRKRSA